MNSKPMNSERTLTLTDVLYDKAVSSAFIPGDVLDRLYCHFGIKAVITGEGRKVIFRSCIAGAPSLTKKARNYLESLLNPNNENLNRLEISDDWFQLLKNNTNMLAAVETEFSVIIFVEKREIYNSNTTVINVNILKEMLRTPVTSYIRRNITRADADSFLKNRPSAALVREPIREEFKLTFVYYAMQLDIHDTSTESITSRIHDDLELNIILPDLPHHSVSIGIIPDVFPSNWIPSDFFYRIALMHGQTFFLLSTQHKTVTVAYKTSLEPSDVSLAYCRNLLDWSPQNMVCIPQNWCEAFAVPGFLYKLERFFGVEIIFDPNGKKLTIQGLSCELLVTRLFTDRFLDKDKYLDTDVADALLLSHNLSSPKDLNAFPNAVKQRLAFFLQGFLDTITNQRNQSHWRSVNPQIDSVIDLDSSDEEDVIMMSGSPNHTCSSSPEGSVVTSDVDALKKMTPSMKKKLLMKTEKAMCLGFFVGDVIQVIIDKGAHKAALLSENAFISLLSEMATNQYSDKNLARPLSKLESQFKDRFCSDYPVTSNSQQMSDSKIEERTILLFELICEALGKRLANIPSSSSSEVANAAKVNHVDKGQSSTNHVSSPQIIRRRSPETAVQMQCNNPTVSNRSPCRPSPSSKENVQQLMAFAPKCTRLPAPPIAAGFGRGRPSTRFDQPGFGAGAAAAVGFSNVRPPQFRAPLLPTPNTTNHNMHPFDHPPNFRPVVIDGCNVSYEYSKQSMFDPRGMRAAVDRFLAIGCPTIFVLVPRKRMAEDRYGIMDELQKQKILSYTPSRKIFDENLGRDIHQTPYDDRIIVQSAIEQDGVIVSNDNYRDLKRENPHFESFINNRLLMYCFVGEKFYVADDPFGPSGPSLMQLLCKDCGNRRQNPHPQQPFRSTANQYPLQRTREETNRLMDELLKILPNDQSKIEQLLMSDKTTTDLNFLVEKLL